MKSHLKVKIKTLAEEAHIIRNMERKVKPPAIRSREKKRIVEELKRNDLEPAARKVLERRLRKPSDNQMRAFFTLHDHRVHKVRLEARLSQLAYAFLRDRSYLETEKSVSGENHLGKNPAHIKRVAEMVVKFSYPEVQRDKETFNSAINAIEDWANKSSVVIM